MRRPGADACSASEAIEQAVAEIGNSEHAASISARELKVLAHDLRIGAAALEESVAGFLLEIREA